MSSTVEIDVQPYTWTFLYDGNLRLIIDSTVLPIFIATTEDSTTAPTVRGHALKSLPFEWDAHSGEALFIFSSRPTKINMTESH